MPRSWKSAPACAGAAILMAAAVFGQAARTTFQTVSIRRNAMDWKDRFRHPMGIGANASLLLLIQFAYAPGSSSHWIPLPASQVAGGPAWIDSEGYDIDAKPGAGADLKQLRTMWQNLLAERFQLKLHREMRELPVYVLTAADNSLQLTPPKEVVCVSFPPGTAPRQIPGKTDCGYVAGPFRERRGLRMQGSRIRMADLTAQLALILNRPVLNQTGFAAEFDLDLRFNPDEALTGMPGASQPPADPNLPNLFGALEAQLGLRLAPAQRPVEVLVIDHAQRPALD